MANRRQKQNRVRFDDIKGLLDEFQKERAKGAALLGATYLDQCLKHLVASSLIEHSKAVDKLLGVSTPIAPLAAFYPGIEAFYCMGLISKDEYDDLHITREIRNEFAQQLHGLSSSDACVQDKCSRLQLPKKISKWLRTRSARSPFNVDTSLLLHQLRLRIEPQRRQRRVVPRPFEVAETVD